MSSFKESHFDKICPHLDGSALSGIPHWQYILGSYYKDTPEVGRQKTSELNMAYLGGGNPALAFLEELEKRHPKLTLKDFCEIAKKIQRNDIAISDMLKDGRTTNNLLSELDNNDKASLTALLNTRRGIPGWKYFADEFDFTLDKKKEISLSVKSEGLTSPSKRMLETILSEISTGELKELCKKHDLNQICYIVTEIENELLERKLKISKQ